jgi:hypothetical protein
MMCHAAPSCAVSQCRFDFASWSIIEHTHHPVDWDLPPQQQRHPLAAKEPRRGRRLSLAADVVTHQGPLRVYCCHLEVRGLGQFWLAFLCFPLLVSSRFLTRSYARLVATTIVLPPCLPGRTEYLCCGLSECLRNHVPGAHVMVMLVLCLSLCIAGVLRHPISGVAVLRHPGGRSSTPTAMATAATAAAAGTAG